jgi:tRNA threonylcarbamoyladenosine biosynthesis protein TsaB
MIEGSYTLALDCTAPQGSAILLRGSKIISEQTWNRGQSHAELVLPAIEAALRAAKILVKDLGLLVVCNGPGSFTGVRVGINVMKSFCYAFHIPIVQLSSLELWAEAFLEKSQRGFVAIPAHDGTFFCASAEKSNQGFLQCSPVHKATKEDLEKLKKNSAPSDIQIISTSDQPWPKAEVLARVALREAHLRQTKDWKAVLPLYVRASSAEEKIGKG